MSKKTFIYLIIYLVIIIAAILIDGNLGKKTSINTAKENSIISAIYYCEEGTINAAYGTSSVSISLSDGRKMILPQTISADGARYEASGIVFWNKGDNAFITEGNATTYSNCVAGIEKQIDADTTNYTDMSKTFSFIFPNQFKLFGGDIGYSQNWREQNTSSGILFVIVNIPRTFFAEKTNFGEAKFTVGTSADPDAIKKCLISEYGNMEKVSTTTINGVQFIKMNFSDAGAGNFYETTSYRAIHDDECYAIEYTIHSSNIYNYSPDQGVKEFDKSKIDSVLEKIAQSFKFL